MLFPYEREQLHWAHQQLVKNHLVAWTSGNCSMRLPNTNMIAIKPSGVMYDELTPNSYVILGLDGGIVEGDLKPSTDTAAHLYIYNHRPEIKAIVHTHSPYVCAWSATGWQPPVILTEQADVFGDVLICDPETASIGDDAMGRRFCLYQSCVQTLILQNHGLIATAETLKKAVQRAVMAEHVCKIVAKADALRDHSRGLKPLSPEDIKANFDRYNSTYGQPDAK